MESKSFPDLEYPDIGASACIKRRALIIVYHKIPKKARENQEIFLPFAIDSNFGTARQSGTANYINILHFILLECGCAGIC